MPGFSDILRQIFSFIKSSYDNCEDNKFSSSKNSLKNCSTDIYACLLTTR